MVPKNSAIIEVQSVLLSHGTVSATMLCSMHRAGSHSFDLAQALMTLEDLVKQLLGLVIQENNGTVTTSETSSTLTRISWKLWLIDGS